MFCQKCGSQNPADALFCNKCGANLEYEEIDQWIERVFPEQKLFDLDILKKIVKQKKHIKKWIFVFAGEILLSLVLLFSFFHKVSGLFCAKHIAERYFVSLANGDWERAYSMLELEEGDFTSRESYHTYFENNALPLINAYSVQEEAQGGTLGRNVTIWYRARGSSSDTAYQIALNKQPKNKLIFFENWAVSSESLLSKDVPVTVPHGAAVSVDGIPLRESYLIAIGNSVDVYSIPAMFGGKHQIEVSMPGAQTVEAVFEADWAGYSLYEMQISQDTLQTLLVKAEADMQKIYGAAFQGDVFASISDLFAADREKAAEIENDYNAFCNELSDNGYTSIETIDMTSISGNAYGNGGDGISVAVSVSFDYQILYSYADAWENTVKTDTYDGRDGLEFYYVLENNVWCLNNLGCHSLYY